MHDSLRFETLGSSKVVLEELYRHGRAPEEYFECAISVPLPGLDVVGDGELTLYVERLGQRSHSFEHANGDRVYRTWARLQPTGSRFLIDVTIRSRQADVAAATISISNEVEGAIAEML